MKKYIISILTIFLFIFLSDTKDICSTSLVHLSDYFCAISHGPLSNLNFNSEREEFSEYDCRFFQSSENVYISNYKWFLDDEIIGKVNENKERKDYWEIKYDDKLKQ